jgi:hypothetical protein
MTRAPTPPRRALPELAATAMAASLLLGAGPAPAQLADPTRPPAGWSATPAPPPRATVAATPASAPGPRPAPAPPPRLQSIHQPAGAPASVLIDGRLLRVGDRLGDATLQQIRGNGVVLRDARGDTRWLALLAPPPAATPEHTLPTEPAALPTGATAQRKEP